MTTTSTFRTTFRKNLLLLSKKKRQYYSNGHTTNQNDPYRILGLEWGDGATSSQIKEAFRQKARALHPDVNTTDTPEKAIQKFQQLQKAYESLMKVSVSSGLGTSSSVDMEEWRVAIWRQGDRIAMDRTDVAGVKRQRPVPPATTKNVFARVLGHPDGRGAASPNKRAEYLGDGGRSSNSSSSTSKSIGTGRNKWVQPKDFQPWTPQKHNLRKASRVE